MGWRSCLKCRYICFGLTEGDSKPLKKKKKKNTTIRKCSRDRTLGERELMRWENMARHQVS